MQDAASTDAAEAFPENPLRNSAVIGNAGRETSRAFVERPTQLDTKREAASETPFPAQETGNGVPSRADVGAKSAEGPGATYIGTVVDGRYRIEGVLGRGGMGVVYRARHEVIDKIVAVKILLPNSDPDVVERFVNEARAATAIGNQHIVDTMDFGALPDGSTYFVMEYLEGETLARSIKKSRFIELSRALHITRQIAEGMSAAHRAGIVHRDLKPENIFLDPREGEPDFVKLLDFGIAKVQYAQNRITRAGTIFGTPHYMSPEQAAGREVDPRADIYSLGVILYEMLLGRVPFEAENPMGLLTQHLYTEPTPLTHAEDPPQSIPGTVDAVVMKCLAKKPEERYRTMAELLLDLDRIDRGEPPAALADFKARAERLKDRALLAAARDGLRKPKRSSLTWLLLSFVVVGSGLGALAWKERARLGEVYSLLALVKARAESVVNPPQPSPSPSASQAGRAVALVFSPIDAEVFRDGKSLGGMPVTVTVLPGETVGVEIRRDGFFPEPVQLDGARDVVVVRLSPIPGAEPLVPVPSAEPLDALRKSHAITGTVANWVNVRHDTHGAARIDAGALRPSSPPPSAPSSVPPVATQEPTPSPTPAAPPPVASAAPPVESPAPPAPAPADSAPPAAPAAPPPAPSTGQP